MKLTATLTRERGGALQRMDDALRHPRPILADLAGAMRAGFARQYSSGDGWAALAARTLRLKRGPGRLVEQGDLRASLTQRGAPGSVETITATSDGGSVLVATRDAAAGPLQRGARGMPPRNPARLDPRFPQRAAGVVSDHLLGRSSGAMTRLGL